MACFRYTVLQGWGEILDRKFSQIRDPKKIVEKDALAGRCDVQREFPNSECKPAILIYGNKMPTRCNRGFYCRSYCLLNMFRALLCPSSGVQEYYTVVAACGISCCKNVKNNHFLHFYSTKYHRQRPLYNTLELLMVGIVMPETC